VSSTEAEYRGERFRRKFRRVVLAVCVGLVVAGICCCVAVAMAVIVAVHFFASIGGLTGAPIVALVLYVWIPVVVAWLPGLLRLSELLSLIAAGHIAQFVMRLVQLLSAQ
jgi:hypothetical protein